MPIQQYTDTHAFTTVYEQNSFEPVARLVWLKDELLKAANDEIRNTPREDWEDEPKLIPAIEVYHYHNDHLGTPNELTNQEGQVIWLADYEAWGNTAKVVYTPIELTSIAVSADELQPIRFQGQTIDVETGLHYNRFRYYDADVGMFISRDPIGLMGGSNVFQYAPNPTGWIDPWGLSSNPCNLSRAERENIEVLRNGGDVYVDSIEEARKLLDNMPELKPAVHENRMPNPHGGLANGFKDPKGTYRGDLINKSNPQEIIHPGVNNYDHANYPHFNIRLPDGNKSAIIIKSN